MCIHTYIHTHTLTHTNTHKGVLEANITEFFHEITFDKVTVLDLSIPMCIYIHMYVTHTHKGVLEANITEFFHEITFDKVTVLEFSIPMCTFAPRETSKFIISLPPYALA